MSEYGDLVAAALHADAEAARAELRAEGIVCPSCGVNMADLPDGHALAMADGPDGPYTAECRAGQRVQLNGAAPMSDADFALWQAVAKVSLWDDFNRRWDKAVRKEIIGEGPVQFTGLIDVLNTKDGGPSS